MVSSYISKRQFFCFLFMYLLNRKTTIENKIRLELAQFDSLNISLDGLIDAILRSFNGYIAERRLVYFGNLRLRVHAHVY